METEFTLILSLAGGLLIGLSAVLLMLVNGRIMGATGILTGLFFPAGRADFAWRAALVLGMASGPMAYWLIFGSAAEIRVPVSTPMLALGGLLVGLGVSYGGGCTSGHGVCGIARLSPRSVVATAVFMAFTAATVLVVRHVAGG